MPFGDSITEATCWRAKVQDQLAEAGLTDKVDFVGSQTDNPEKCATKSGTFDTTHEGHSGWTAKEIAEEYIAKWAKAQKPDIVNFHLGTNDVKDGGSPEEVIKAYDTILEALRAANPNVKVIVSSVLLLRPHRKELVLTIWVIGRQADRAAEGGGQGQGAQRRDPRVGEEEQLAKVAHRDGGLLRRGWVQGRL